MSDAYYETICEFINFLQIQDESTLMYKTGRQLIDLCKMTNSMANIEKDAMNWQQDNALAALEAEDLMLGQEGIQIAEVPFKIDEFKSALAAGNEVAIYDAFVNSNLQANNTIKVPLEALFLDYHDGAAFRYRTAAMDNLGVDTMISVDFKGSISLADCNLVHRLMIKGFSLNQTVKYVLD